MTADQRNAINSLLATGSVMEAIVANVSQPYFAERAARWKQSVAEWERVRDQVQCHSRDCENVADSGGIFCTECWHAMGPYDRPISESTGLRGEP
jgi:hypothetical protein